MEVHHHSHTARKKWTHYFWEFLMLFLAVFCGFLAEYKLEQTIERHREKEFIISMIEDAQKDTSNFRVAIEGNIERLESMRSLILLCYNYSASKNKDSLLYTHYRRALTYPYIVNPTERTMTQLKNSGGMRLIRNKKTTDIIIEYDYAGKELINQSDIYQFWQNEAAKMAFGIFNFKYYNPDTFRGIAASPILFRNDKAKLIEFANLIVLYTAVIDRYKRLLENMDKDALNLMTTLRKEYGLN